VADNPGWLPSPEEAADQAHRARVTAELVRAHARLAILSDAIDDVVMLVR
jgi:hypothetical protein